jgi:outer membrane autotransporter protein
MVETDNGGNATASNSGSNIGGLVAVGPSGGNITITNSGSNDDIQALSFNDNITVTNSGSNTNGVVAQSLNSGNIMVTNSGTNTGGLSATTRTGNATVTNSGSNDLIEVFTTGGGNATANNSGTNTVGILEETTGGGNATVNNSGSNTGGIVIEMLGGPAGNATVTNSGSNPTGIEIVTVNGSSIAVNNSGSNGGVGIAALALGSGNVTATNSGSNTGMIELATTFGNATVINSGITTGLVLADTAFGTATLTNIVGGRVIGPIELLGTTGAVNFQGGNWLFTFTALPAATTFNTGGAPFVVVGNQVAVLDPTTFALADRALTNFTGEVSEMLQDRFAGMTPAGGSGGGALGFAGAPTSPVASEAQAAFSGIPSVAMSYASAASRPVLGKAPAAAAPYYDTTVWASGFGGERKQRADGDILPTTDTAFGGAMGVDRVLGGNLRLGAFVGAGASREAVELDVQTIDATYVFGGAYGRFDWATQYLDFSLYGGGIDNKSTRQIANNTVASGFETATASYGGWFINPEVTYGYRIPFNAITVTPRVRLRYVGGELDGYSESGSMQNLSVGSRAINDLEERGEVELSTVAGAFKGSATIGIIGLERLGNPTVNTVLLGQNLSFVTPGQASAFGGVVGMRMEYRAMANVALFVAGEATAMSDKSDSFAASGGARVSF